MKISKLIELLKPYADCEALVETAECQSGDDIEVSVTGIRISLDIDGVATKAVLLT